MCLRVLHVTQHERSKRHERTQNGRIISKTETRNGAV